MNIPRNPRLRMIALLVAVLLHPGDAFALDLGLTPSHVFSMWTNINESLVVVGGVVSDDKAWRESLSASKARKFEGKRPGDVLELGGQLQNQARQASGAARPPTGETF